MKGKIVWAICALMLVTTGVAGAQPIVLKDSLDFDYTYEMDVAPNNQDLDVNGTDDWYDTGALAVSGGLAIGGVEGQYFRTDYGGSIWRSQITGNEYTLEFSVKCGTAGSEGTVGTMGCFARNLAYTGGIYFTVARGSNGHQAAAGYVHLGDFDNTDAQHVFRIARESSNKIWIWRDGELLNPNGDPITGDKAVTNTNILQLGDIWSTGYSGPYEMEYIRLTAGAYTPAPSLVGISETGGSTEVIENGASDSYTITFDPNNHPTAVTITIDPDDELDIGAGQGTPVVAVFPAGGHESSYAVNVSAWNDGDTEGPHIGVITHTVTANDPNYDGLEMGDVTASITDDDGIPGIVISKTSASCDEDPNYTDSYTVSVETPPSSDVTVTINTGADLKAVASLVFNSSNWLDAQTVAVEGQQDGDVEGTEYYAITHSVSQPGGLGEYDGMAAGDVAVVIGDDDANGPTATTPYAWYKAESGAVAAGSLPAGDGEQVIEWQDQSGNLRHLDNANNGGALYEATGAKGGQPALRTSSGTVWIASSDFGPLTHPKTIIMAATDEDGLNNYYFDSSTSTNRSALFVGASADSLQVYAGAGPVVAIDPTYMGSPAVLTTRYGQSASDPNSSLYFNGLLQTSGDAGTQELRGLIVGARYNAASRLTGTVTEVLVYDGVLSSAEQAQVEDYLMAKWLEAYEVYETGAGGTIVTEEADPDPNTDNFYVAAIGNHGAGTVTSDPDADLNLGSGGDTAINLNFVGGSSTEMVEVVVTAVDDGESEGPEVSLVVNTGSEVRDVAVTVNDNERYCGDDLDGPQTYAPGDVNQDCYVNLKDFAQLAAVWLDCTDPFDPINCVQELP